MLKFGKKEFKRILSILLSVMMAAGCFAGLSLTADAVSANDIRAVYVDDFSNAETLGNWRWLSNETSKPQYTASIADGSMTFNNVDGSGSFLHSARFIPDKYYTNQRVAITFKGQLGIKPTLWARLSQPYKGNSGEVYGYYLLFNCNQGGSLTLDLAKRIGGTSATIGSVSFGSNKVVADQEYTLEMVCQGTNPTLISVSLYTKVGSVENAVVCHNTFLDSEAKLQVASSAGVGGARTSAVTATDAVIDSFEFTSTDKVTGNYYVEEGSVGSKTFGQVVNLDPTKSYVLSATAKDNGVNSGGELTNPLWIEYFNTSSVGQRVLISRGSLSSNRTEESVGTSGIEYGEYYKVFYEFDMSALTDNKVEEGLGNKTRVLVGFRCDGSTATSGKFTNFTLYAKDDANKTNLLINPDFKMGLYGWNDEAGSFMNYAQIKEGVAATSNAYATLSTSVNNYEFYNVFKNTGYEVTQGDATRDNIVDVKDLVRMKKIASGIGNYFVAADFDGNGLVNALDTIYLRKQLIAYSDGAPEDFVGVETAQKIARLGYRPYDVTCPPEQSLASYELACEKGYEILLCDVRTTADGEFVALHDKTINSYATDSEGNRLTNADPINLNDLTLAEVDAYDFGIYRGEKYAGTKIMRVADFVEFCKTKGVCAHLELKEVFTQEKLDELAAMIKAKEMDENIMINGQNAENLRYLAAKLPSAIMGTWVKEISDSLINTISTYGENNPKFIYVSNGGEESINYANYIKCQEKGIDIAYTEIRNEEELAAFKAMGALKYCKYVATRYELY